MAPTPTNCCYYGHGRGEHARLYGLVRGEEGNDEAEEVIGKGADAILAAGVNI